MKSEDIYDYIGDKVLIERGDGWESGVLDKIGTNEEYSLLRQAVSGGNRSCLHFFIELDKKDMREIYILALTIPQITVFMWGGTACNITDETKIKLI